MGRKMTEWRRGEVPTDFGRKGTGDCGAPNTLDKAQRIGVALLGGVRDTLPAARSPWLLQVRSCVCYRRQRPCFGVCALGARAVWPKESDPRVSLSVKRFVEAAPTEKNK